MSCSHVRVYRDGQGLRPSTNVDEVSERLADPANVVWIDVVHPSVDDLQLLADELGLHELAIEDALEPHQRPKLDHYSSHLFLSAHLVDATRLDRELGVSEVDMFIGPRWLITVRHDDRLDMTEVASRLDRSPELVEHGVSSIVYALLDAIVDGYFDAISAFDDFYESVVDGIFADSAIDPADQRQWFAARRALVRFHRLVSPLRDVIGSLTRREHDFAPEPMYPYFQDVYDHMLRVGESVESLRDLMSTIVETNLALRDFRQNQIMKRVTSWAAIIAVPTLVTGFYGMNVPFPGDGEPWGVVAAMILILASSTFLYFQFKRRDWL